MAFSNTNFFEIKFEHHPEEGGWYGISPDGDMLFFTQKEYEELMDKLEDMELAQLVKEREGQPAREVDIDDL